MMISKLFQKNNISHGFTSKNDERVPDHLVTVKQVHGNRIYFVEEEMDPFGYDALICTQFPVRTAIGIKTADCVPLLMADLVTGIYAAVHAGWKGTSLKITEKVIDAFVKRGSLAENILVAIGPCIRGSCYEVGEDVQKVFQKDYPSAIQVKNENKWWLDVREMNRLQLLHKGILEKNIDVIDECTHCRADLFYSYRREGGDGGGAGRMISFIG